METGTSRNGVPPGVVRASEWTWRLLIIAAGIFAICWALAQVFIVERRWRERGHWQEAVRYGITSLPPAVADADRLLALVRGHWQIENGLHSVKDVTLGEDRSLIRKGHGPNIMAILRDTVISVLHRAGWRTIAERLRCYSGDAHAALALLGISLRENA